MGWLRRLLRVGRRAITDLPWVAGGPRSQAVSADRALQNIALFACVRLLADSVASLPLQGYRKLGDRREPMSSPPPLFAQPAANGTTVDWLHRCMISLATRGNAYGIVTARDGWGYPLGVEWLDPDSVHVDEQRPTLPVYYLAGQPIPRDDVVHIAWFVPPGAVVGLSPVSAFAASLGVGLAATSYGSQWFEGGGQPPGTFRNSQRTLNAAETEAVTDRLVAKMRSGKPLVYGADWEYSGLSVTPEESQFVETLKLNATQIATIYGVPPEMVGGESGGSLTYNNPELNGLQFVKFTLRPWLVRLETAFNTMLPERQFMRFNVDQITRADLETRYRAHHLALIGGWKSRDEIRALEDLPPIPGGQGKTYEPLAGASQRPDMSPMPSTGNGSSRLHVLPANGWPAQLGAEDH